MRAAIALLVTLLVGAIVLVSASAPAHAPLGQGKSAADRLAASTEFSTQDIAKPPCTLAPTELTVGQQADEILVYAESDVDVDRATIWSTLSDYDHLARFIPGMSSSRTVSRNGAEAVVEQRGNFGIGPFHRNFKVLLNVKENLYQSISISGVGGDFRRFESRYDVVPLGPQCARIVYHATLVPEVALPPIVGLSAMRSMIGTQFNALLREMRRRTRSV
jgi:carbon monoxide dehydrogenase subunit G